MLGSSGGSSITSGVRVYPTTIAEGGQEADAIALVGVRHVARPRRAGCSQGARQPGTARWWSIAPQRSRHGVAFSGHLSDGWCPSVTRRYTDAAHLAPRAPIW